MINPSNLQKKLTKKLYSKILNKWAIFEETII